MINLAPLKSNVSQLRRDLKKAKGTLALSASLPGFFRDRITIGQAQEEIKRALDSREQRFLELACTEIYQRPTSPYLRLLKFAGCEFSDLRSHVRSNGLEKTLKHLATEGVYLTSDEFKGKKEVIRGGLSFRVCPDDFEVMNFSPGLVFQSSGTTNRPLRSVNSLDWLTLRTWATGVFYSAHDLFSYAHAVYDAIPPGTALNHLLVNAKLGKRTECWFARKIPTRNFLEQAYFVSVAYLTVFMGKHFGPGFPKPEFLDVQDIHRIIQWTSERRSEKKKCYVTCVASTAVRIARLAWEMGVSLEGVVFGVAGDPLTGEKEKVIKKSGGATISRYSYGGGVSTGYGCAHRIYRDEVHVNQHLMAVVSHPTPLDGYERPIRSLLLTTLHPAAPRLLFNVANGDYVTLDERNCECALQKVGLTLHLHHIRSYEKFTSEGMNYLYEDIYELLEKTFPSEFGGGPGDYQLVEEEDDNAQTRLTLVVDPAVGPLDESQVIARLQIALSNGSRGNRFMVGVWKNAGTFRLKRDVPHASPRGKILPLHIPQAGTDLPNT